MNISEVKTNQVSTIVGTVAFFARESAPSGWLKCNGAPVGRTDYPELYASIGTTYGAGNGSTTFNLPDLRGEFIRCWDDGRGIDNGRTLTSTTNVANVQDWSIQDFTGYFGIGLNTGETGVSGVFSKSYVYMLEFDWHTPYRSGCRVTINPSNQIKTSTETRPRNVPLLACIKY